MRPELISLLYFSPKYYLNHETKVMIEDILNLIQEI